MEGILLSTLGVSALAGGGGVADEQERRDFRF